MTATVALVASLALAWYVLHRLEVQRIRTQRVRAAFAELAEGTRELQAAFMRLAAATAQTGDSFRKFEKAYRKEDIHGSARPRRH